MRTGFYDTEGGCIEYFLRWNLITAKMVM